MPLMACCIYYLWPVYMCIWFMTTSLSSGDSSSICHHNLMCISSQPFLRICLFLLFFPQLFWLRNIIGSSWLHCMFEISPHLFNPFGNLHLSCARFMVDLELCFRRLSEFFSAPRVSMTTALVISSFHGSTTSLKDCQLLIDEIHTSFRNFAMLSGLKAEHFKRNHDLGTIQFAYFNTH